MKIIIIDNTKLGNKIYINNKKYIVKGITNIIKRSNKNLGFHKTTIVRLKKFNP